MGTLQRTDLVKNEIEKLQKVYGSLLEAANVRDIDLAPCNLGIMDTSSRKMETVLDTYSLMRDTIVKDNACINKLLGQ